MLTLKKLSGIVVLLICSSCSIAGLITSYEFVNPQNRTPSDLEVTYIAENVFMNDTGQLLNLEDVVRHLSKKKKESIKLNIIINEKDESMTLGFLKTLNKIESNPLLNKKEKLAVQVVSESDK